MIVSWMHWMSDEGVVHLRWSFVHSANAQMVVWKSWNDRLWNGNGHLKWELRWSCVQAANTKTIVWNGQNDCLCQQKTFETIRDYRPTDALNVRWWSRMSWSFEMAFHGAKTGISDDCTCSFDGCIKMSNDDLVDQRWSSVQSESGADDRLKRSKWPSPDRRQAFEIICHDHLIDTGKCQMIVS